MKPFLKSVAEAYIASGEDMSRMCMLFPNKRSGRFFLKYLKESMPRGATIVAPEVITISDLVQLLSGRIVDSRIDVLLVLYRCYCDMRGIDAKAGGENVASDFEHFRIWGETMLQDFDEVDMYGVNPDDIFKNVKDYREISSNFLTPEQRKVMAEYFGRSDMEVDPGVFWRDFAGKDNENLDPSRLSPLKRKFLYLWETMSPLYHALHSALDAEGLATSGGAYRKAAEALAGRDSGIFGWRRMGVVGFNALTTMEFVIFSRLAAMTADNDGETPFADFFWDGTGPVLSDTESSSTRFISINRREFPSPEWAIPFLRQSDADSLPPDMRVIASPSNAVQAKLVGEIVGEISAGRKDGTADPFADARVAVVVPDENLLLPLLYSLPQGTGDVNLTMGYSLRLTSTISFVTLLRQCHNRQRKTGGKWGFHYADLRLLLSHPYSQLLFGAEAVGKLNAYISRTHAYAVTPEEAGQFSDEMLEVLRPISATATPSEVAGYLDGVLGRIKARLEESGNRGLVKSRLDCAHIDTYRDALRRLRDALHERGVNVNFRTILSLADRLLGGEKVNFEGEPLSGLQVMGVLETRSLDFDTLIIPSMNERIMPMKARRRTFIPDTLRAGYGMPPSNYQESLFAYYFFRLISRARRVVMLYDSRTGAGGGAGDVSRYVLQLRHLFAKGHLQEEERRFAITGREEQPADIEKDRAIMEIVEKYAEEGTERYLSASSLRTYCDCQARFCYEQVLDMREEDEGDEYMDAATQGTVLHNVIMELYLPEERQRERLLSPGLRVTESYIDGILADTARIDTLTRRAINRHHFRLENEEADRVLTGETAIVAEQLRGQIEAVLRHDRTLTPFTLLGCEIKERLRIPIGGKTINVKLAIDRLDRIHEADGRDVLRIVDYKTGRVRLVGETLDDLFTSDYRSHNIFQLFFYAWALGHIPACPSGSGDVRTEIYDVGYMSSGRWDETDRDISDGHSLPVIGEETVTSWAQVSDSFTARLDSLVGSIFDSDRPFEAATDTGACLYCRFKAVCGR